MNLDPKDTGTTFMSFPALVRGPGGASLASLPGAFGNVDNDVHETPTDFELPLSDGFGFELSGATSEGKCSFCV